MGFSLDISVPALTVFLQGLLSFFSPCVLPLIPIYIGYLSGGTATRGEDGRMHYKRGRVMLHTVCFVVGVSFAFFLLGLGVSALGSFFSSHQLLFARIGGVLVLLFGAYQLGVFGNSALLAKERRLPFKLNMLMMSPVTALIMGFTFSFAWTPCVGPALASVLLMAASAGTRAAAFGLIAVYTLGFVLPFLAVGLFTTTLLEFFRNHMNVVKYTVKIGGILMVFMGLLMITGKMNDVTGYLSRLSGTTGNGSEVQTVAESETETAGADASETGGSETAGANESETDRSETVGTNESGAGGSETDETEKTESAGTDEAGTGAVVKTAGTAESETEVSETESVKGNDGKAASAENDTAEETESETQSETARTVVAAPDISLTDQYGEKHTLSDYKGKTIFLNFWATWCPPCRAEMPDIQKLYETYDQEGDDALVVLGIAAPGLGQETDEEGIADFLEENGYTYPVLMDTTGEWFSVYGITSFPTTFMIDREGNVYGYVTGQLSEEIMNSIIEQTMEGG